MNACSETFFLFLLQFVQLLKNPFILLKIFYKLFMTRNILNLKRYFRKKTSKKKEA